MKEYERLEREIDKARQEIGEEVAWFRFWTTKPLMF
jgi:hypothetical protein